MKAKQIGALCSALLIFLTLRPAGAASGAAPDARVYVAGEEVAFRHLGLTDGDPVCAVSDPGMTTMLHKVGATLAWQPGTSFAVVTRADGKLITFSLGSDALTIDGNPVAMPFAPFSRGSDFYVPLLPLARALELAVRGFHSGYVFVPQLLSIKPALGSRRSLLSVVGSARLTWRSSFDARHKRLSFAFPGFGTDLRRPIGMQGRDAAKAEVQESGPPGYPVTSILITLRKGVKFAARRQSNDATMEVVLSRDPSALRDRVLPAARANPAAPRRVSQASSMPAPQPTVQTSDSPGVSPGPSGSPPADIPAPPPLAEQKIMDVSISEQPGGTRIILSATGPVAFSWHRLAEPDNRYWLDIDGAVLVGPAQALTSKLPFIKDIKVSQHELSPNHVVRLAISPTQPIDVRASQSVEDPNQLVVEIENAPPAADAPSAGSGSVGATPQDRPTPPAHRVPTQPDLIVIDAGHGGNDPGAVSRTYGLIEKRLTLSLAKRVQHKLKDLGWQAALTREGDYEVGDPGGDDRQELQARCDVANAAGARLFVSIHINSSISSSPSGATTYYWRGGDRSLARSLQDALTADAGVADDGVRRGSFYVIRHANMQAALVEVAFLSNHHDAVLLNQPSFLDKVAAGIVHGITDYTGGPPGT